ncbi:hypothetical protein [Peterkaempfera sp. SMS 1(5)a]|uniref:hypothetical protein n=1 Tax=Peterkaempfera podocarpi TaxID=3232308 RepID=UPI00367106FF
MLQLRRDDFPEVTFPVNCNLLQVLWCPRLHDIQYSTGFDYAGPWVRLVWRDGGEEAAGTFAGPSRAGAEVEDTYLPRPCSISPERVIEYSDMEALPPALIDELEKLFPKEGAEYQYGLSVARGWKVGGWPSWHSTDLQELRCEECSARVRLLLKFDSAEWDGGSDRWRPLVSGDDGAESEAPDEWEEPTGVLLGHWGEMRVFVCETDVFHAPVLNIQ